MYISLPRDMRDRSASIVFVTNNVGDYRWHLRVTQIDCNRYGKKNLLDRKLDRRVDRGFTGYSTAFTAYKPSLFGDTFNERGVSYSLPAPHGCLQYYTAPIGVVESFNFGEYLNNLDYAICIERQPTTCRVIFSASDFQWSVDKAGADKQFSGVGDQECPWDYLNIPAGSATGDPITKISATYDRYCGGVLNFQNRLSYPAPVISKANGPIILRFHTDNTQDATVKEGFRLRYEQSSTNCVPMYQMGASGFTFQPTPVLANLVANAVGKNSHEVEGSQQGRSSHRNNNKLLILK